MTMRPLIVAQAPSSRSDPREPLSGMSGQRLAYLCDLSFPDFLASFERVNLLDAYPGKIGKGDRWDQVQARLVAYGMTPRLRRRRTVLLGRNVARAFHLHDRAWFQWVDEIGDGALVAVAPHPSGISHFWNDLRSVRRACWFWHTLARS